MALVSGGGGSRLNPNAPLYIPAAVRKVEDFTPEWYDLISTSTWYHDYWLSQHQEANMFDNNKADNLDNSDIVDMLPDDIDFAGIEEDMAYMDSQLHEFARSYGHQQANKNIFANGITIISYMLHLLILKALAIVQPYNSAFIKQCRGNG